VSWVGAEGVSWSPWRKIDADRLADQTCTRRDGPPGARRAETAHTRSSSSQFQPSTEAVKARPQKPWTPGSRCRIAVQRRRNSRASLPNTGRYLHEDRSSSSQEAAAPGTRCASFCNCERRGGHRASGNRDACQPEGPDSNNLQESKWLSVPLGRPDARGDRLMEAARLRASNASAGSSGGRQAAPASASPARPPLPPRRPAGRTTRPKPGHLRSRSRVC